LGGKLFRDGHGMKYILLFFVKIYQKLFSNFLNSGCRYRPTCSQYAEKALREYGALRGSLMSAGRLLRCNPFAKGGFDPVPDNFRGEIKWVL
jgi:putative membrane protein insertion efficiency factor